MSELLAEGIRSRFERTLGEMSHNSPGTRIHNAARRQSSKRSLNDSSNNIWKEVIKVRYALGYNHLMRMKEDDLRKLRTQAKIRAHHAKKDNEGQSPEKSSPTKGHKIETYGIMSAEELKQKGRKQTSPRKGGKKVVKSKFMEDRTKRLKKIDLSTKESVIVHLKEMATNSELIYVGVDEQDYPKIYISHRHQELEEQRFHKDFDSINKRQLTLMEKVNRDRQQGQLFSKSLNFPKIKELDNMENTIHHRNMNAFENQIRLLENQDRSMHALN